MLLRRKLVVGALMTIVALGISGIALALLSDTAKTGKGSMSTRSVQESMNLKLAAVASPDCTGATYSDDLTTDLFSLTDAAPSSSPAAVGYLCVENTGAQTTSLNVAVANLVNVEIACTGDEALVDTTCAPGAAGEAGIYSRVQLGPCPSGVSNQLGLDAETTASLGNMAGGETRCLRWAVLYSPSSQSQELQSQSDKVSFNLAFSGGTQ